MSDTIILTLNVQDGEKLKSRLVALWEEAFTDVPCLTKETCASPLDVEAIFSTWYMPVFTSEEVRVMFPKLKAVYYAAGTVKYFAEPFLQNGVRVFSAAMANGVPVAEFAASQIILAGKGCFQAQRSYRWPAWRCGFNKARQVSEAKGGNFGASVGIIGCGTVGSKVVEQLKPHHLNILVYDPYLNRERLRKLGVKEVNLEELFASCDVISNHLPDTEETRGVINYSLLSLMKPTATFINTGRGRQVVERDLARVMRRNKEMCALLDVTSHEPMLPWNPLYFCKNVFLTPHIAGSMGNEFGRMVEYMVQAYKDVMAGRRNAYEVTLEQLTKKA